ncbi:uncharacterized protein METZ01_LOCUS104777 [marine metagenome]|uniref:Uncharacterized protein n=1 Tax=marine metagenome TaxID=408172 RepID=A0A381WJ18_9ZZZZ
MKTTPAMKHILIWINFQSLFDQLRKKV